MPAGIKEASVTPGHFKVPTGPVIDSKGLACQVSGAPTKKKTYEEVHGKAWRWRGVETSMPSNSNLWNSMTAPNIPA